mmetsp:Transcript_23144/g.71538  ORF Transcript_23144/g.71538 Transcript_23144/m.71538 type:complete len:242 (+) Transcript_23144:287-1012(+)
MDASRGRDAWCSASPDSLMRWPYFEPWVATLAFALFINGYQLVERGGDWRAAVRDVLFDRDTPVLAAGLGYFVGIGLFRVVVAPAAVDWGCPSSAGAFAAELVYGVLAYDVAFYCLHRGMHALCYKLHARHHRSGPRIAAHHVLDQSVVDAVLHVLTNIVAQRRGPFGAKNWLARLAHNLVVTFLLTDSHADTPSRLCLRFPRLLAGAARHREHHAHSGPPYQQFGGWLDALFSPPPPAKI